MARASRFPGRTSWNPGRTPRTEGGYAPTPLSATDFHRAIIIFTLEGETAGKDNLVLTEGEVELWCEQHDIDD